MQGFNSVFTGTAYVVSLIYSSLWFGLGSAFLFALLSLAAGYLTNVAMDHAESPSSPLNWMAIFPATISLSSAALSTAIIVDVIL